MEKEISLPEAQMEVMEVIWDKGGRTMFGVLGEELAARGKSWKPNTILTLLSRLAENGMLTVRKQGRLNEYVSLVSREEYQADPGPASGRPGIWRRHKASDIRSCQSGISDGGGL